MCPDKSLYDFTTRITVLPVRRGKAGVRHENKRWRIWQQSPSDTANKKLVLESFVDEVIAEMFYNEPLALRDDVFNEWACERLPILVSFLILESSAIFSLMRNEYFFF